MIIKRPPLSVLAAGLVTGTLTACSPVNIQEYSNATPTLALEEFFNGDLVAHGMVRNRSGKITRRFEACIKASWNQGVGTLDEYFIFDDGERQTRVWTLTAVDDGQYRAEANDVIGSSPLNVAGNAAFMNYALEIKYKGKPMTIRVDDRMYRVADDIIINESTLRKFGIDVGSLLLTISKGSTAQQNRPDCSTS